MKTNDKNFSRIEKAVMEGLSTDASHPVLPETLFTDVGADSMTIVSIALALEDEFGISIPDSDFDKIQSMKSIQSYIGIKRLH
jgi:acyl carrier protein